MSEITTVKSYNLEVEIGKIYSLEDYITKSYSLIMDINKNYDSKDEFYPKTFSYPYIYSELNTMSYNTLNAKKYKNLLYAYTKSYIDIDVPINKTYSEVIICNKLV